ncbi:hypothetical protein DLJ96_05095 [Actinotalea fermentans ATCC 43279 = JCM 9966 = DSM 3133]|nr:hypothetical protein DLJ96_05095 [Actinotalea fermentans ATCC 43279 = JCM 9966 = DSM 3133]
MSPGVLRGLRFTAPTRGVRLTDATPDLTGACRALSLVLRPDTAFSHTTALHLLDVEVPWRIAKDQRIHVVSASRQDRPDRRGVVSHFCGQPNLTTVRHHGLLVTSAAQTWLHLSHRLTTDELVVLGDAMLRRKHRTTTPEALRSLTDSTRKMKGLAKARVALDLLRPGTDSSMETRARLLLVHAGLPCPVVNRAAIDDQGRFLALPDMSYPERRIAIEYDGDVHRTDPATWRRDVERRQRLEAAGWIIITATADDVLRHPERFVARVRAALQKR